MQLAISFEEIQSSPAPVKEWFLGKLGIATGSPAVVPPVEKQAVTETPTTAPGVSMAELIERATAYIEAKGTDGLKAILSGHGIKRVKECPADKIAALFAELAING